MMLKCVVNIVNYYHFFPPNLYKIGFSWIGLTQVTYALLALTRAYGVQSLEWAKECVSLIPLTALAEVERSRFLQALSEAASGVDVNCLMTPIEELSDVCRRNRTVQEIVQGALKPLELNRVPVS